MRAGQRRRQAGWLDFGLPPLPKLSERRRTLLDEEFLMRVAQLALDDPFAYHAEEGRARRAQEVANVAAYERVAVALVPASRRSRARRRTAVRGLV